MLKSVIVALITIPLCLNSALADYFIQITTSSKDKVFVDESDAPGGIEIYKNDEFVACILGIAVSTWDGNILAPVSIGFISKYPLKELSIKPRGAMNRMLIISKETKF